ncbi:hypothetical protein MC885_021458 [Smutsia gigantea]|nr:hypothetical protein MC885_021458 [Smutsia gigantea]
MEGDSRTTLAPCAACQSSIYKQQQPPFSTYGEWGLISVYVQRASTISELAQVGARGNCKARSRSVSWPKSEHLETVKRWALAVDVACFLCHFAKQEHFSGKLTTRIPFLQLTALAPPTTYFSSALLQPKPLLPWQSAHVRYR